MITRFYFVAYGGGAVIGSFHVTTRSWFPKHESAFATASDYVKEHHPGCAITVFQKIG